MAPFCLKLFFERKSIVFISLIPPCHEISKRHLCYLNLGKRNKFYNLSYCNLISNNCQCLKYLENAHLLPLTDSFLRKRKQIKKIQSLLILSMLCYRNLNHFGNISFPEIISQQIHIWKELAFFER